MVVMRNRRHERTIEMKIKWNFLVKMIRCPNLRLNMIRIIILDYIDLIYVEQIFIFLYTA